MTSTAERALSGRRKTFFARKQVFIGPETPEEQETSPALALIQGPLPLPATLKVEDRCPFPQSTSRERKKTLNE